VSSPVYADAAPLLFRSCQGFAIGGTSGFFCVYEKTDDKREPFIHIKTLKQGMYTCLRAVVCASVLVTVSSREHCCRRCAQARTRSWA
jgi:hypothetical protein